MQQHPVPCLGLSDRTLAKWLIIFPSRVKSSNGASLVVYLNTVVHGQHSVRARPLLPWVDEPWGNNRDIGVKVHVTPPEVEST